MMHLNPLVLVGAVVGRVRPAVTSRRRGLELLHGLWARHGGRRDLSPPCPLRSRPTERYSIVGVLMLFSIAGIISPHRGRIEELVAGS